MLDSLNIVRADSCLVEANLQGRSCSVPFYVAAPTTTLDAKLKTGQEIEIEERDPRELTHHQGKQVAAVGINVR